MANSTKTTRSRKAAAAAAKPKKPYRDFPLTQHQVGYWCKSIRGKIRYFGRWGRIKNGEMVRLPDDGWREALNLFLEQKDDLFAGRTPREKTTVWDVEP